MLKPPPAKYSTPRFNNNQMGKQSIIDTPTFKPNNKQQQNTNYSIKLNNKQFLTNNNPPTLGVIEQTRSKQSESLIQKPTPTNPNNNLKTSFINNNEMTFSLVSMAQIQSPQYQDDKVTLKDYLQAKNLQRRIQYRLLNFQQGYTHPLSDQKQQLFEKQHHDIKGFIKHVIGQGSLFNKFVIMIDNLYLMFMKQITVYHKLKFDREQKYESERIKQFKNVNDKLTEYLKKCESDANQVEEKLEHIKKTKEFYKKEREAEIKRREEERQKERKQKQKEWKLLRQKELAALRSKMFSGGNYNRDSSDGVGNKKRLGNTNENKPNQKLQQHDSQNDQNNINNQNQPKDLLQIEKRRKRQKQLGKISNVFASFIHE